MTLTADARLARLLSEAPTGGVYFLHGDATRLRDEAASRLADAWLDPSTRDFNFDHYRGDDVTPEEFAATLAMPPMMAERRVVTVQDVQKLGTKARAVLLDATASPPPDLVLILTATIPERSKARFYRDLQARATTLAWDPPRSSEVPGWLIERSQARHGFRLDPAGARVLAAAVGDDLSRLDSELEKLASVADGGSVDVECVRGLVHHVGRVDRWTWLDLVASRDYGGALRQLDDLLTSERGVPLVGALIEHHLFVGIGMSGGQAAIRGALGETGRGYLTWKAATYAKQARAWTGERLRAALEALARADLQLKSGGSDRAVITELLVSLDAGGPSAS